MRAFMVRLHRGTACLAVLCLFLSLLAAPAQARMAGDETISPEDEAALLTHLPILAQGRVEESWYICEHIMLKPGYSRQQWTSFFDEYFQTHPFTLKLYEFLTWPAFWAASQPVQENLQAAMDTVMRDKIMEITSAGGDHLGSSLAADPARRETLAVAHRWEMTILIHGRFTQAQKQALFDFYIDYVYDDPQYWAKSATIDLAAQPYVAGLAAQVHTILRELANNQSGNRFIIEDALDLQGRYQQLWDDFLLLLYDNNGFDAAQRDFLYKYYNDLPRSLRLTRGISQMEFIGNSGDTWLPIWLPGVNVFPTRIGSYTENPFPPDIPPRPCDGFLEVVAHEVNHPIYAIYIEKDPDRYEEFMRILNQAGTNHMHYLRSMFEDGFFFNNRQELFASIANQYFCSSEDTFRLGLERFELGIPYPLDQALYFAEVYSTGANQTYIYSTDLQAKITRQVVDIYRDGQGRITGIDLPSGPLYVRRNVQGIIVQVGSSMPQLEASGPLKVTLLRGETATRTVRLSNTGGIGLEVSVTPGGGAGGGVLELLPGDARVIVPDDESLSWREITIEAWVNPLTWDEDWTHWTIVSKKGSTGNNGGTYLILEQGGLKFKRYYEYAYDHTEQGILFLPNWSPPPYRWTHIAAVSDDQIMRLYVNGVELASGGTDPIYLYNYDPLIIGEHDSGYDPPGFPRLMDDLAIWSVVRSAEEIRQDMLGGLTGSEPGLTGLWQFDSTGPVAVDSSPNHNDGALEGQARQVNGSSPVAWLSVDPVHAVIPPGRHVDLAVHVSTGNLTKGTYQAHLRVESNDPIDPILLVPVTLTVLEPAVYLPQIMR